MEVKLYTDGAAKGNPDGPGGYGAVIQYEDQMGNLHEKEISQGYIKTTNNRMELMGVIRGLECLNRPCQVTLYSDSKYVVDAFLKNWLDNWIKNGWRKSDKKPVKNMDLWKKLLQVMEPHEMKFVWVKGHDGHEQNERCDQLATEAAEGNDLVEDVEIV